MTPSENNLDSNESWEPCSNGEIQGLVNTMRKDHRNRQLKQAGVVGVSLVLLFSLAIWSVPLTPGATHAGISCADVIDNAEDYVAGRVSDLLAGKIELHMQHCRGCTEHVRALQAEAETSVQGTAHSPFSSRAAISRFPTSSTATTVAMIR